MTSLRAEPYACLVLDLFYIAAALGFFVLCWAFTQACEKL